MAYSAVHKALAENVAAYIRNTMLGASIIGVDKDSVRVRKVPVTADFGTMDLNTGKIAGDKTHAWPAILVCYYDFETFDAVAGSNARDEIGYPIAVVFVQPNNFSGGVPSEDGDDQFLRWREAVERTYSHLRGVGGQITVTANTVNYIFHNCTVKPGSIFDWNRWRPDGQGLDFGWLILNFILWRPGGA